MFSQCKTESQNTKLGMQCVNCYKSYFKTTPISFQKRNKHLDGKDVQLMMENPEYWEKDRLLGAKQVIICHRSLHLNPYTYKDNALVPFQLLQHILNIFL